mmetsp:Transcript_13129/g.50218  ORF Transcript_13129/g.50218 Transcript_13129/m.50218 type:complete len:236 (+) Transcript_13129:1052-1759(+)
MSAAPSCRRSAAPPCPFQLPGPGSMIRDWSRRAARLARNRGPPAKQEGCDAVNDLGGPVVVEHLVQRSFQLQHLADAALGNGAGRCDVPRPLRVDQSVRPAEHEVERREDELLGGGEDGRAGGGHLGAHASPDHTVVHEGVRRVLGAHRGVGRHGVDVQSHDGEERKGRGEGAGRGAQRGRVRGGSHLEERGGQHQTHKGHRDTGRNGTRSVRRHALHPAVLDAPAQVRSDKPAH